jgi:hypothetical protein
MFKKLLITLSAVTMALFLVTASAEEGEEANSTAAAKSGSSSGKVTDSGNQSDSLMNQPVNFSTPENVEKTLQHIREKEGDRAYKTVKIAMQYIMYYDLSLRNDKEKLYKKLDGNTPEQIIAMMKR